MRLIAKVNKYCEPSTFLKYSMSITAICCFIDSVVKSTIAVDMFTVLPDSVTPVGCNVENAPPLTENVHSAIMVF